VAYRTHGGIRFPSALGIQAAVLAALTFAVCGDAAVQAQERRVTLTVKPVLCITDRQNESCTLTILVAWRTDAAGTFCLHNDVADAPIQCWQLASSGSVMEQRVVASTLRYWLTDGTNGARIAEASLEVLTTESADRRRNRQRRHVWDIL
jgi:DUF3019 family protein